MKPSILILGTDHFTSQDNGDLFSTEKMDMLSPGRQDEIREVLMCLEAFKPTKIALEVQQERGWE